MQLNDFITTNKKKKCTVIYEAHLFAFGSDLTPEQLRGVTSSYPMASLWECTTSDTISDCRTVLRGDRLQSNDFVLKVSISIGK